MALEAAQLILPGRVVVSMLHSPLGKRERMRVVLSHYIILW